MVSELPNYAYFKGKIVPYSEAKVGVLNNSLNYGTAVFGGIRAYWNEQQQQLFLFRPLDHYRRFLNSAKLLRMNFPYTPEVLTQVTIELLCAENIRHNMYVRPLAYWEDEAIGVKLHGLQQAISIVSIPFDGYVTDETKNHVTISSWRRADDNIVPARGKISGAYANSALIKSDAVLAGFDEALVLNNEGHIAEGSAMNVFMVRDGVIITPPVSENILEGITRRSVIELAKELGIPVIERPIDRTEVFICDEFFFSGTAAQVSAVTRVDYRPIGSGEMGPITTQLRNYFIRVTNGEVEKYKHWNVPVF